MQYRIMPKTKDKLSILGYGCMRFKTNSFGKIAKENAIKQVRMAIDNGVNYLDTAYPYHRGESESFLGEYILKDGYREKVKVATKLPTYLVNKPQDMDKYLNKQLSKLKINNIDYYLLHSLDGPTWRKMLRFGVLDFMNRIKKEGKITYMGFSYHGTREDFYEIIDGYEWDFCQIQYNYLDEYFQAGIDGLNYAYSKNIGVIVMEPLRGGQLVGAIPKEVQAIWNKAPIKRSPAEWAFRFIYNHPAVIVVLSGMSEDAHIIENIKIANQAKANSLTEHELAIINEVKETYQRLLKIGCTGCRYCIPCPVEIDIPYAFQTYNNHHMFGGRLSRRLMYARIVGMTSKKPKWTTMSIDCGKCEKACPQNLKIRDYFRYIQKDIETPVIRTVAKVGKLFIK